MRAIPRPVPCSAAAPLWGDKHPGNEICHEGPKQTISALRGVVAVRSFLDPEGREWSVWDVVPSRTSELFLPSTMADGWLCFEAAHEKRRLHPVDATWHGMDEAALWALCQSAAPVKARAPRFAPGDPQPQTEPT